MDMVMAIPVFNSQVGRFIWFSQDAALEPFPNNCYSSSMHSTFTYHQNMYSSIIYAEIVQQQYLDG